jgi:internalin A
LEALVKLQTLNLDSNKICEIKGLEALTNLRTLHLDSNKISDIKNLEKLLNLESLWLSSNQIKEIKILKGLPNLHSLWLDSNQIDEIKDLENLTNLEYLWLSSNQITEVKNLNYLVNLQYLALDSNQIREIKNLDELTNLKYLWLSSNQIKEVKNLKALFNLQYLGLDSNKISEIKNLENQRNLEFLWLSSNQITEMHNLETLENLTKLDLSNNNIRKISNLESLKFLQFLHINKNEIHDTKIVKCIPLLADFQVAENKITEFDTTLLEGRNILRLYLAKNECNNIPSEIINLENCLSHARAWFKDLDMESIENFEAKLMLVGNGRVGKTSILRRLFQDQFNPNEDSTHGIQLYDQNLTTDFSLCPLRVQAWDFGGQEIYHATHRLFMQSRALYLALWDWTTEHKPFAEERFAGELIRFRNYELAYWLDHARALSWQSPLMVVQNKIDQHQRQWPKRLNDLQKRYSIINFHHVSAATGEGVSVLKSAILEEFRKMPEVGMKTPAQWLRVKEKLLSLKADFKTIDFSRYQIICDEEGLDIASTNALISFLHNTGNLFYQSHLFQNQIILDQEWALEGLYALFQRGPFYKQLKYAGGRTSLDVLAWPWQKYDLNTRKVFLSMMESCEICFKVTEDERDPEYIITEFLPGEKDEKVNSFWEDPSNSELFLKYQTNFFHQAFISRFIARAGRLAKSFDHMWRNGIWITFENAHALIEAFPDEHQILVRVKGEPGALLLYLIHNAFKEIFYEPDSVDMNVSLTGKEYLRYKALRDGKTKGGTKKVSADSHRMIDLEKVEFFSEVLDARSEDEVKRLADIVPKPKVKMTGQTTGLQEVFSEDIIKKLKAKLKGEIGKDLGKALENTNTLLLDGDLKNQLIAIQGRFASLKQFLNLGKLKFEEYELHCNQIRPALIEIIDGMEGKDLDGEKGLDYLDLTS